MTTPTEELRETLTKLAEGARIAYVRWEKDQSYDGEKVEYDLVEDVLDQLLALLTQQTLEARIDELIILQTICENENGEFAFKLANAIEDKRHILETQLAQLKKGQE